MKFSQPAIPAAQTPRTTPLKRRTAGDHLEAPAYVELEALIQRLLPGGFLARAFDGHGQSRGPVAPWLQPGAHPVTTARLRVHTDWQSAPIFKSPYSHPDVGAGYD